MGRNKSRYIDKADKKKLKDKSTVLSTTGHDIGRGTILKDSSSYISGSDKPTRRPFVAVQLRTGDRSSIDTDARAAHLVTTLSPRLAHGLPIYVAYDLETSFEAFSTFLDVSCPKCGHAFSRRDLRYDTVVSALGRELADVAFDMAFAAHASQLYLTDDRRGVAGPVGDVLRRRVGSLRYPLLPDTRVSTKLDNY